jgi:hypothetical protein
MTQGVHNNHIYFAHSANFDRMVNHIVQTRQNYVKLTYAIDDPLPFFQLIGSHGNIKRIQLAGMELDLLFLFKLQ